MASEALTARQKVQHFLTAACVGNLDLLKNIASQLDEGSGMSNTVADIKDANKRGALHFAAREGQTEVCKYLLEELKLDVDTKDEDGETPIIHAARQGHTATAKYLLDQGANPVMSSDLGATALHHSAGIGNNELMEYLLSKGAEVDSQSDAGTPLIWAAGHGQQDALKVLLEHHANVSPEAKERAAEAKSRGDDAFKRNEYLTAVNDYAQAIDLDPTNAAVLSNRSLCWIRLGQPDQALADAKACIKLKPDWPKAWYREGAALRLLQRFDEAANSFYEGVKLDPENTELVKSFREAVDAGRKFHGTGQGKP